MSNTTTNGNGTARREPRPMPTTLQEAKEQALLLRWQNRLRRARREERVLESYAPDYWDFGGSDLYFDLLRDRYGDEAGGWYVPPSMPHDRKGGAKRPIWWTEQDLARMRQASRILCDQNSFAMGMQEHWPSYITGKGLSYKASPVEELPEGADPEALKKLARRVQRVVDDFCKRNRWNSAIDPRDDQASIAAPREQEACQRVYRDGEAFIRFWFRKDGAHVGKTDVRFVEPELVRQPPGATPGDGWDFGVKSVVREGEDGGPPCEDLEAVEAFHVNYREPCPLKGDEKHSTGTGDIVPARNMVHIKGSWEDAATKRGSPFYRGDVIKALTRAARLQETLSTSANVQAARAEHWEHDYGTSSQLQQMETTLAGGRQRTNPVTGQVEVIERVRGGTRSRVPAGQKLVAKPAATGVPEYQMASQGDLRQAGAAGAMPEYLVSGDASNANFASTQEAGTPFVRRSEKEQEHFKGAFLCVVWRAVRWAVECGLLPPEALSLIEIQAEAPQIAKNNEGELAQQNSIYMQTGVKAVQQVQMELGLDPAEQQALRDEWNERNGQQGAGLQMPGGDQGDPLAGLFGPPQQAPPQPAGVQEGRAPASGEGWRDVPDELI